MRLAGIVRGLFAYDDNAMAQTRPHKLAKKLGKESIKAKIGVLVCVVNCLMMPHLFETMNLPEHSIATKRRYCIGCPHPL
jgi:hypothetical protein